MKRSIIKFKETKLNGAYVIDLSPIVDERGYFARSFSMQEFKKRRLRSRIVQCNVSFNAKRGTIRGMHYQIAPHQEAKLIWCPRGTIHDVIVDLRKKSLTYCQWFATKLGGSHPKMVYVPEGFAHGFETLEDNSVVFYHMFEFYHPECARGVRWNDEEFGIKWPIRAKVISRRDRSYTDFVRADSATRSKRAKPKHPTSD